MKKSDIAHLLNEVLKDIDEDAEFMLGNVMHVYELEPHVVCGMGQAWMPYYCVREPDHEGECYCACKHVNFVAETKEEIEALYKSIK
jgi:hypothetical protein